MTTEVREREVFVRDQTEKVVRWGIPFRSVLEVSVAEELDRLGIEWAYERGVEGIHYLPDFTVLMVPDDEMDCPQWIEVKPPEALYAVRDYMGLASNFDGQANELFTSDDMRKMAPELCKPKKLAELQDEPVLVVSAINRNRTLSIMMHPGRITISRSHPLVNWKSVLSERERVSRRTEWVRQAQEREAARWVEAVRREDERHAEMAALLEKLRYLEHFRAKYDGRCVICEEPRPALELNLSWLNEKCYAACRAHFI